jgi:hypothetical protein
MTMQTTQREKDWMEEFDKKFPPYLDGERGDYTQAPIPHIKSFIQTLLTQTDQAAREDEREKMIKKIPTPSPNSAELMKRYKYGEPLQEWMNGYNASLKEVLALLTSKVEHEI